MKEFAMIPPQSRVCLPTMTATCFVVMDGCHGHSDLQNITIFLFILGLRGTFQTPAWCTILLFTEARRKLKEHCVKFERTLVM